MKTRRVAGSLALIIIIAVAAVALSEIYLRRIEANSGFQLGHELRWMRRNKADLAQVFTIDPDFGFRPILGNELYNEYGTLNNGYRLEASPGVARLLFVGDSVTRRGRIVDALKEAYGEGRFEYWNAGVESFNTAQEVQYYIRYNSIIKPDHVILTFVYNDFGTTPIAFFNRENKLVVYAPNASCGEVNPWLFRHSYLYRFIRGNQLAAQPDYLDSVRTMGISEVRRSLEELGELLDRDGIAFTVLILPKLKPPEQWEPYEREQRTAVIRIVEELNIKYFDLYAVVTEAIKEGIRPGETSRDHWHPGPELSRKIAGYLYRNRLLEPGSSRD